MMKVWITKEYYNGRYEDEIQLHFTRPKRLGERMQSRNWGSSGLIVTLASLNGNQSPPGDIEKILALFDEKTRNAWMIGEEPLELEISPLSGAVATKDTSLASADLNPGINPTSINLSDSIDIAASLKSLI